MSHQTHTRVFTLSTIEVEQPHQSIVQRSRANQNNVIQPAPKPISPAELSDHYQRNITARHRGASLLNYWSSRDISIHCGPSRQTMRTLLQSNWSVVITAGYPGRQLQISDRQLVLRRIEDCHFACVEK